MSVITISRGSFSGGKIIAEKAAVLLDYRCVDRDVIVERAAARGVSQDELREALDKAPTFLDRFQHNKYLYLTLIQAALTEEVKEGRTVYHGNAGHLLLRGAGPVMRVRVIAPMEFRIQMAGERLHFTREEALDYIEKVDRARKRWTQYLYGVDWQDPSLYDLVINVESVSVDDAADLVAHLARKQKCFEFDCRCREAMENLALAIIFTTNNHIIKSLSYKIATASVRIEKNIDAIKAARRVLFIFHLRLQALEYRN